MRKILEQAPKVDNGVARSWNIPQCDQEVTLTVRQAHSVSRKMMAGNNLHSRSGLKAVYSYACNTWLNPYAVGLVGKTAPLADPLIRWLHSPQNGIALA